MRLLFEELAVRFADLHRDFSAAFQGLPQEALDWRPAPGMNSLAVLATHAAGAERGLVGTLVGGEVLPRDREGEFHTTGLDAAALTALLDEGLAIIRRTLDKLAVEDLEAPRTRRTGEPTTVAWGILHALDHTALHTGHAQITRQLWEQRAQ